MKKKVVPIKKELRGLLEEFLSFPTYQSMFRDFARLAGYMGEDEKEIKNSLFAANRNGEIIFTVQGLYELFLEFQLLKQLSSKALYKELLEEYPEAIMNIRVVAQKILRDDEIFDEDMESIFNTEEYDKVRAKNAGN